MAKPGRSSSAKLAPMMGESREARLNLMVQSGYTNDAIWAAEEGLNSALIPEDDPRRKGAKGKKLLPFDPTLRKTTGWAIRSCRNLVTKARNDIEGLVDILGTGSCRPVAAVPYENIPRFSSGIERLDEVYGKTEYQHTDDADGHKKGDKTGKVEIGLPSSFVSIWAGAQGVGKSRLACRVMRSLAELHPDRNFLYCFGESNLSQLRVWIGQGVEHRNNFLISDRRLLAHVVTDIYQVKPMVVFVDSVQALLDCQTTAGQKIAVGTFKQICTEPAAGMPHIILISQLNKKGDVRGTAELKHLADFVAFLKRREGIAKQFIFECPEKNRGGPTPEGMICQHTDSGVEVLGPLGMPSNLMQLGLSMPTDEAIQTGIAEPEPEPHVAPSDEDDERV